MKNLWLDVATGLVASLPRRSTARWRWAVLVAVLGVLAAPAAYALDQHRSSAGPEGSNYLKAVPKLEARALPVTRVRSSAPRMAPGEVPGWAPGEASVLTGPARFARVMLQVPLAADHVDVALVDQRGPPSR